LSTVSLAEREAFLEKLDGDDRERIIDELLLVLDRHDSVRKSEIQAKLLKARIRERLTTREYLDLTHAVSTLNVDSLDAIRSWYRGEFAWGYEAAERWYAFVVVGLMGGQQQWREAELAARRPRKEVG
jgi:hypothetical protein